MSEMLQERKVTLSPFSKKKKQQPTSVVPKFTKEVEESFHNCVGMRGEGSFLCCFKQHGNICL